MKPLLLLVAIALTISCEAPPRTSKGNSVDQEYPNPFSPTTTLQYEVTTADTVTVVIYNLTGQVMDTVVRAFQEPGIKTVKLDDRKISSWKEGIYFYRVTIGDISYTKKMVLMK
ncbi:MAG: T9SS type A sorting domain-containing protein [bacterium]|nr:T9SS type A sorting domain-containing protein [bacterium]